MLVLASSSSTRAALLSGAGVRFVTCPAHIDERRIEAEGLGKGHGPESIATGLAEAKARAVSNSRPDAVVLGADQVLALDGELLHKPADRAAAAGQLDRLRGRTHRLVSAAALARQGEVMWSEAAEAWLTMRPFTARERDQVLALEGEAVLASVGSYRLEGPSIRLFERIDGDYFTVLGLPLLPLLAALRLHAPEILEGFT